MRQAKLRRRQQRQELSERRNAKHETRKAQRSHHENDNIPLFELNEIVPKTISQKKTFEYFEDGKHLVLNGSAGTGKSFIALYLALKGVIEGYYDKVIILRSARSSLDQGFLPGDIEEKMQAFEEPYINIVADLVGRPNAYAQMKSRGLIQFASTSFLRGVTFKNAIVILDEAQNATAQEGDTVVTRLDNGCRLIVIGDAVQTDYFKHQESGFAIFTGVLKQLKSVAEVVFGVNDIVRSGLAKEYLTQRYKLVK